MPFLRNKFFDTFILFIITFLIAYTFKTEDPFITTYEFNIYFYVLCVISLFYGFVAGAFFLALYIAGELLLVSFNLAQVSHYFISLFIFSEFHYYWNSKIEKLQEINKNLQERLEELASSYYILKISHDEIEKSYILKPYSIRNIFHEIKTLAKEDLTQAYEEFFLLLKKIFKIQSAALFFKTDTFEKEYYIGEDFDLDLNDPLIKETLNQTQLYTSIAKNINSKYLAVIPVTNLQNELQGLFVIKDIPFFSLTEENLMVISLFLNYFINSVRKINKHKIYGLDENIIAEIEKLLYIYKNYKLESYMVITPEDIEDKLRTSDLVFKIKNYLIIILPFTTKSGVNQFIQRTKLRNYKSFLIKDSLEKIVNDIKQTIS